MRIMHMQVFFKVHDVMLYAISSPFVFYNDHFGFREF